MHLRKIFATGLVFLISLTSLGQILESYPASIKWHQINTSHFKVIFPSSGLRQANEVANALEHYYDPASSSLFTSPRKIRVVVNNQTAVSNGFVAMAPRRSEIFTAPPQDFYLGGSNQWLPFVTLHEYRHIVQFQKSFTGFNKLSYLLFGPEAFNVMAVLATPSWFWEGDAVVTETAMSPSGRGRIPEFDIEFRSPLLTRKKPYSYYKQYLGSYKDFVPDHYRIGYFMSAYLREKYGNDIWEPIVRQANNFSFFPFTFSLAMRSHTGKFLVPQYKDMMQEMKSKWQEKIVDEEKVEYTSNKERKVFTNYLYPQNLTLDKVLVVREGIGNIQEFVTISSTGKEERIFTPGVLNRSPMISAKNGKIAWTEYVPDYRWPKKSFSVIKIYDTWTRLVTILTLKDNYASADLSDDMEKIISVYTHENGSQKLTLLLSANGNPIKRYPNPDSATYQQPRFGLNDSTIAVIKITSQGKSLVLVDVKSGNESEILKPSFENIGYPVPYDDYILYNSSYNGVDNIYAVKISTREVFQLTEAKFGAFNPLVSPDGEYLYFNLFQEKGMDLVKKPFAPSTWKPIEQIQDRSIGLADILAGQEMKSDLLETIPENNYTSKRYRRISGIFNPISWGPYLDATTSQLFVGIRSQDVLSNLSWDAGYIYDNTDETTSWKGSFTYQGIYTPISSSITYGKRFEDAIYLALRDSAGVTLADSYLTQLSWYETEVVSGLSLPLNLTNGRNFTRLSIENSISYIHKEGFINPGEGPNNYLILPVSQGNGDLIANNFLILFSRLWRQSKRDINSKFGQYFIFKTSGAIGGDYKGSITTFRFGLFFPGLAKHHSLFLRGGWQGQKLTLNEDNYRFRNQIEFPRGFAASSFETFSIGSINYAMPLLYPDLAIGPLLYIQRLKTNLFFDFASGSRTLKGRDFRFNPQTVNYLSGGVELTFDFNIFRLLYPFEAGIRFNFMNDPFGNGHEPFSYEFVIASFGF